jgi:hypothetical protein
MAVQEFHKVYGHDERFAKVVGGLHEALNSFDGNLSPGQKAARAAFNMAGQDPQETSESLESSGSSEQKMQSANESARGSRSAGQGSTTASVFRLATARKGSN